MRSVAIDPGRARPLQAWNGRVLRALATLLIVVAAGCGGGTTSDVEEPPPVPRNDLVGTATPGFDDAGGEQTPGELYPPNQVTASVRGSSGFPRGSNTYDPDKSLQYRVSLTDLTGPYMVSRQLTDGSLIVSAAPRSGRANISPLTTLLVAQMLGKDPATAFNTYNSSAVDSIARITDANIAAAQVKVTAYLQDTLGVAVQSGTASFVDAAFAPRAGDAMYDTILALNAKLAADGSSLVALSATLAAEARLCLVEQVSITIGGKTFDFCPQGRSVVPDTTDATVIVYGFTSSKGDALTVRARDAAVLTARFVAAGGGAYECSAAGCAGLSLGGLDADGGRPIVFAATRLTGAAGTATLNGRLRGGKPGPSFPPLPCSTNNYYIVYPDDRVDAACAAGDSTIGAGIGDAGFAGTTRRVYTFRTDGSVEPAAANLEVRADGQDVVSLFVQDIDPETGTTRGLYKCRGAACNGVTIGPARDDPDSFAPYILRFRTIEIADASLPAIGADGTPTGTGSATVRASIDSFELIYPDGFFAPIEACTAGPNLLGVTFNDATPATQVCPPAVPPDGIGPENFRNSSSADGGATVQFRLASSNGSGAVGGITVSVAGSQVVGVTFDAYPFGPGYSCSGAACAGVTVSAPDGVGERVVTFTAAVLQEVETAGILNPDRTATVNGSFVAPAYIP